MYPLLFRVRINSHRKNNNKQTKGQLVKHVARVREFEMIEDIINQSVVVETYVQMGAN